VRGTVTAGERRGESRLAAKPASLATVIATVQGLSLAMFLAASAAAALVGCGDQAPPARTATVAEPGCPSAEAWRNELEQLRPAAVRSVEGHMFWNTCAGTAAVAGTKLVLRSDAIGSDERDRLLLCRRARIFLPSVQSWLPDGWVDIDVEPVEGGVALSLSAESVPKNIRLLHDLRAFVIGRPPAD
jgi:hypothetical protein